MVIKTAIILNVMIMNVIAILTLVILLGVLGGALYIYKDDIFEPSVVSNKMGGICLPPGNMLDNADYTYDENLKCKFNKCEEGFTFDEDTQLCTNFVVDEVQSYPKKGGLGKDIKVMDGGYQFTNWGSRFKENKDPNDLKPAVDKQTCLKHARKHGYIAWGYRNEKHNNPEYRQTCTFYSKLDNFEPAYENDLVGTTACTWSGKSVKSGCK